MNANQPNEQASAKRAVTAADIPLTLKARYVGTGFVMGVIAAPAIRQTVARIAPRFSELLDTLTGQAEKAVEGGADVLAQARDLLRRDGKTESKLRKKAKEEHAHDHDHDHAHDHDHDHKGHSH